MIPPQSPVASESIEKPSVIPKSKYIKHLETYLSKELRLLGCPATGPHELRLQAHREVFEYLIEGFKMYKPILSAIKNEYELYLHYLEEIVRELRPIRVNMCRINALRCPPGSYTLNGWTQGWILIVVEGIYAPQIYPTSNA